MKTAEYFKDRSCNLLLWFCHYSFNPRRLIILIPIWVVQVVLVCVDVLYTVVLMLFMSHVFLYIVDY